MTDSNNTSQKPKLDSVTFTKRFHTFIDNWQDNKKFDPLWKSADGIAIVLGKATDDDPPYRKTPSFHNWLLGYEFPETILVFCEREVYVLASAKKVQILEPLQKGLQDQKSNLKLHCLTIKTEDNNASNFKILIDALRSSKSGKNVGVLTNAAEKMIGPLVVGWEDALKASNITQVDVRLAISDLLSIKDSQEIALIRQAADIAAKVMDEKLIASILGHIDQDTAVTHNQLAEEMDEVLENPDKLAELMKKPQLKTEVIEGCYTPIIQSGGKYNLSFTSSNDDENLHYGTIICSLGARYRSYCANIARTLFVDPEKEVEENYKVLTEIFNAVVKALKVGNKMSQPMEEAARIIQRQAPHLITLFLKTCGTGIGIEFQEAYGVLSAKNTRIIKSGMLFNVAVGFKDIVLQKTPKDSKNKTYAMLLSDTVLVTDAGAEVLTDSCLKVFTEVSYSLEDDSAPATSKPSVKKEEGEGKKKKAFAEPPRRGEKVKSRVDEEKLRKHQEELAKRLAKNREKELAGESFSSRATRERDVNAYADPSNFPAEAQKNKVHVDIKRETILIPIFGTLVPFHITKIKNVSKSEDLLRVNFNTPTATGLAHGAYVKEVSIRVADPKNLNNNVRLIKELRKRVIERETAADLTHNLVEQPKLILSKQKNPRLGDLYIRPNISGRHTAGYLELHNNGCRFITNKNVAVDILYANVKHAFFQPSDNELIILIHFHLRNEIMIGKKRSFDVQFYSEVSEGSQHLDHGSRSYDRDEIEDEQREAEVRNKLDKAFQNFIKKAEEVSAASGVDLEFDIPYRELGFYGVPQRSNVLLQPTVHCLVSLVDTPFFVLSLSDVEICHFERVSFGLRNFDMVFVHKDLKKVSRVNNVPIESLETIKEWLDSCNIKFYEGPTNLNWPRILSTIREDADKFYKDGAWDFLRHDDASDEDDDDPEDADDDFAPEGSDSSAASGDDSNEEYDEASESDSDDEDEESDVSGEDWDTLEKQAAADDQVRGRYDEEVSSKRKRGGEYSDEETKPKKKKAATKSPPKSTSSKSSTSNNKGKK